MIAPYYNKYILERYTIFWFLYTQTRTHTYTHI